MSVGFARQESPAERPRALRSRDRKMTLRGGEIPVSYTTSDAIYSQRIHPCLSFQKSSAHRARSPAQHSEKRSPPFAPFIPLSNGSSLPPGRESRRAKKSSASND